MKNFLWKLFSRFFAHRIRQECRYAVQREVLQSQMIYGSAFTKVVEPEKLCHVCGGKKVFVRGRHPEDDNREVCPTCLREIVDEFRNRTSPDYGKTYSSKP